MSKIILYVATSLDGKIARNDGQLDWLYAIPNPNQIDHGYADFLSEIGTTIMGSNTYKEIIGFGVDWPYKEINSYVASTQNDFPITTPNTFKINGDLADFVKKMKQHATKDIWLIGGGQIISYFLDHDLLDKMILTLIPIILSDGIPLFPNKPKETNWTLEKVEQFETGLVKLTYNKKE